MTRFFFAILNLVTLTKAVLRGPFALIGWCWRRFVIKVVT